MHKEKLWRLGRRLLILALTVTAVLLLTKTGYYTGLVERYRADASAAATPGQSDVLPAKPAGTVLPMAAMVCTPDNGRCGAAYDDEATTAMLRRFSSDLGEALGSARAPEEITEEAFCQSLACPGLFLRFFTAQPLELLSAQLGTELSINARQHYAQMLCLYAQDDKAYLNYQTDDGFYRCDTAVMPESLRSRAAEYLPNGARYAWESETLPGDGYDVVMASLTDAAVVKTAVALPAGDELDALLELVGINSYTVNSYTEADGTTVFVGGTGTLRLSTDGTALYRRTASETAYGRSGLTAAADLAWHIAEESVGKAAADGMLYLTEAAQGRDGNRYGVRLDYAVNGIPVRLAEEHAADLLIDEFGVVQARLVFRRFTVTEERLALLPYAQAAAIAAMEDMSPRLMYVAQNDTLECGWVKSNG